MCKCLQQNQFTSERSRAEDFHNHWVVSEWAFCRTGTGGNNAWAY